MKVLFLNPPSFRWFDASRVPSTKKTSNLWYPIWLAYAAGLVRTRHEVKLVDAPAQDLRLDSVLRIVDKFDPELIVIEVTTPSLSKTLDVCRALSEKNKDCKIVLVGPHATARPRETMIMSDAVFGVIRGEYDFALLDLADTLESQDSFENVLGLSWNDGTAVIDNPARAFSNELDRIPFVSSVYKDFLDPRSYHNPWVLYPYVQILSARGCPYRCTFCLWPQTIEGHEYRTRSIENFVSEIEYISQEFPKIMEIFIDDSTFTVDKKRVRKICDLLLKKGIDVSWSANARVDVDTETLQFMKKAGCRSLVIGYESGVQGILDSMKKGTTLGQGTVFARKCQKIGIMVHGTFIFGFPGESEETIRQTMSFVKKVKPDTYQFSVATPYPGTEFFASHMKTNAQAQRIVSQACDRAYITYSLYPLYWVRLLLNVFQNPRAVFRWLRSGLKYVFGYLLNESRLT